MENAAPLNSNLFNLYMLFTREPFIRYFTKELEFFTNGNNERIGLISYDFTDKDFSAILFSRDESKQYRADYVITSLSTIDEARSWIDKHMGSDFIVHHGSSKFFDLFGLVVNEKQRHPYFEKLNEEIAFSSAKAALKEISYHYRDIDGNFIQQFQSLNGFDSRLWELYLFCFCREEFFSFNRSKSSPDFMIEKEGYEIAVEAMTVNPRVKSKENILSYEPKSLEEIQKELENEMPIKFSGILYDKLKKKYWELENVKGKPLLFAVADFHEAMSMTWSFPALFKYLYGYKYEHSYNEKGELIIKPIKIDSFLKRAGTPIPANFFSLPGSENVSAVLFSSTATLSKFNRIGKQAGLGSSQSIIHRFGTKHNHNINASTSDFFNYEVDEDCRETWAEGVSIFHNPMAKIPLEPALFPSVAHHFLREEYIHSKIPDFFPYSSLNLNTVRRD